MPYTGVCMVGYKNSDTRAAAISANVTITNGQVGTRGRRDAISLFTLRALAQQIVHRATSKPVTPHHTENSAVPANLALSGVLPVPTLAAKTPHEKPIAPSAVAVSPLFVQSALTCATSPNLAAHLPSARS